jgi:hypothetical protein
VQWNHSDLSGELHRIPQSPIEKLETQELI